MPETRLLAHWHLLVPPLALALDRILGEPPAFWHPVCHMGRLADALERRARVFLNGRNDAWHLVAGGICLSLLLLAFCLPAALLALLLDAVDERLGLLFATCALWLCVSPRAMEEHALAVANPLARGNLFEARHMLSRIVGRETQTLDAAGVARAAVESVAENSTDGTVASLFWAAAGLVLGGAPAACALVLAHRVANTLDAMWGRKDEKYLCFGRCAARLDDVLAYVPARLTLPLTALACLLMKGTSAKARAKTRAKASAKAAFLIGLRFCRRHESPNSAFAEAAFAGALGLTLGGPCRYQGRLVEHPTLGTGRREADAHDIKRAIALMKALCLVSALLAGLCAAVMS